MLATQKNIKWQSKAIIDAQRLMSSARVPAYARVCVCVSVCHVSRNKHKQIFMDFNFTRILDAVIARWKS